ncbi:autotransporter domain-containing protein [Fusobacterium varium]|uniref:autotransporter domain-containing protein n=1 Tax=Fusobacterium varium TaxID=856 RepID=UPI003562A8D3
MIKEIEKALKRYLKGKNRITMGVVVAFLLGSSFAFGDVTIKYDTVALTLIVQNDSGTNIGTITGNHATGFTWTVLDGTELKDETVKIDDTVNAKKIKVNIVNNGIIRGKNESRDNLGNGINSYSETSDSIIGAITNNGTISGSTTDGSYSGNGIYSYSMDKVSTIGNILNHGTINGNITGSGNKSGNGINSYSYLDSTIGHITNSGNISGKSGAGSSSGNGIYSFSTNGTSTIGDITNSGTISGSTTGGYNSGNGIFSYSKTTSTIGHITNSGNISGSSTDSGDSSENGIFSYSYSDSTIGDITNSGTISGKSDDRSNSGNGIYSYSIDGASTIGNITNSGTISGSITGNGNESGNGINSYSATSSSTTSSIIGNITNSGTINGSTTGSGNESGNGIYSLSSNGPATIKSVSNYGVIMGSDNGIYVKGKSGSGINDYYNYGLVIGQTPVLVDKDGSGANTFSVPERQGMAITLESDGSIKTNGITSGTGGSTGIYSIINTVLKDSSGVDIKESGLPAVDAYNEYKNNENISNSIINGVGYNETNGTVTVKAGNFSLNGGIINAYKTAVTVNDGASFTGTDVTINGGGLDRTTPVISGDSGANTVNISGNSFINGKVDLGDGDDILSIGAETIVNGNLDGGTGNDILNFGIESKAKSFSYTKDKINVLHNISNFKNINVNENTFLTFFEDVEITGLKEIKIAETGVLSLRLKDSEKTVNVDGKEISKAEHALLGNGITILGEGNGIDTAGTLNFITNGIGKEIYVDMTDIELKNLYIKTSSVIDGYKVIDEKGIILGTYSNLDEIHNPENTRLPVSTKDRYDSLNNIYKGIYNSTDENINALRTLISSDSLGNNYDENMNDVEQLKTLMSYLGNIYTETPYSFSSELSRKSMGIFRDIVADNQFKPELNKWMIMGGLTHADGGSKDTYYGQNYHEFDADTAETDVDMKLTGAYALGKYGYSENISLGITAGGNKSEAELSISKVKGNSGYIGAFIENYRKNLTLKAGAGIQYSEYDADRRTTGGHNYDEKYSDMAYDIYLNGRYSHNIGDNLYLEPYGTLSYTYIKQDGADEGSKILAIETDSKSFDYTSAKAGVDIKKVIPHENGKSTLSAGVSYTRLLNGADEEYITGRFAGGSDFDILVAHKNKHSIGLNTKYTLELENGILFDVKGNYVVERDSHNGAGKNKTKGEWIIGIGLGYKF